MAQRHKAREYALQMLFQWEIGRQQPERIERGFWQIVGVEKTTRAFADALFEGAAKGATELDARVASFSQNWRPERFAVIDRVILRLAAYELGAAMTPPKVVLNEAIELAKKFSSADAAPFINGILDSLMRAMKQSAVEKTRTEKLSSEESQD
jgi:transcription antitermination protein NusB